VLSVNVLSRGFGLRSPHSVPVAARFVGILRDVARALCFDPVDDSRHADRENRSFGKQRHGPRQRGARTVKDAFLAAPRRRGLGLSAIFLFSIILLRNIAPWLC
jgi:hypothetical protein